MILKIWFFLWILENANIKFPVKIEHAHKDISSSLQITWTKAINAKFALMDVKAAKI